MFARLSWYNEICPSRKEIMNLQSLTRQNLVGKLEIRGRAGRRCRLENWLQRIYYLSYLVQCDRCVSSNLKSLLTTSTIWSQVSSDLGFAVRSEYLWLKSVSRICSTLPKCSKFSRTMRVSLGKVRVNISPQHCLVAHRTHRPKRCRSHNLARVIPHQWSSLKSKISLHIAAVVRSYAVKPLTCSLWSFTNLLDIILHVRSCAVSHDLACLAGSRDPSSHPMMMPWAARENLAVLGGTTRSLLFAQPTIRSHQAGWTLSRLKGLQCSNTCGAFEGRRLRMLHNARETFREKSIWNVQISIGDWKTNDTHCVQHPLGQLKPVEWTLTQPFEDDSVECKDSPN